METGTFGLFARCLFHGSVPLFQDPSVFCHALLAQRVEEHHDQHHQGRLSIKCNTIFLEKYL
ncbi:MAG: hypothetical protein LUD84_10595, partial [Clostridiales bacterium]|nr:hypothetical protein [Clostridiales bacterium]